MLDRLDDEDIRKWKATGFDVIRDLADDSSITNEKLGELVRSAILNTVTIGRLDRWKEG